MYFKKQKKAVYRFSTFCTDFYLISVVAGKRLQVDIFVLYLSVEIKKNETVLTLQVFVL